MDLFWGLCTGKLDKTILEVNQDKTDQTIQIQGLESHPQSSTTNIINRSIIKSIPRSILHFSLITYSAEIPLKEQEQILYINIESIRTPKPFTWFVERLSSFSKFKWGNLFGYVGKCYQYEYVANQIGSDENSLHDEARVNF